MKNLLILFPVLLIFSCSFPSTRQGMTLQNPDISKQIGDYIFVKESTGGSITLPFWTSEIPNDNFTAAVEDSLLNSESFSGIADYWDEDWGLEITILDVEQPLIGIDLAVSTRINYSLFLKGKRIYKKTITVSEVATIRDSLFYVQRLRLANERSAKKNIKKFIKELSKQDFKNLKK